MLSASTTACVPGSLVRAALPNRSCASSPPISHIIGISPWTFANRQAVHDLIRAERPDFIIHTAAQPSHDKAASIKYEDFDINTTGTLNLLAAACDFVRDFPFCFTSTNSAPTSPLRFFPEAMHDVPAAQWQVRAI